MGRKKKVKKPPKKKKVETYFNYSDGSVVKKPETPNG